MGNAVRADDPGPATENSCIIRVSQVEVPDTFIPRASAAMAC